MLGTVTEHKKRFKNVLAEMILIIIVKAAVHMTMLAPIFLTGRCLEIHVCKDIQLRSLLSFSE